MHQINQIRQDITYPYISIDPSTYVGRLGSQSFRQLGRLTSNLPWLALLVFCDQIRSIEGLGLEFRVASCRFDQFSNSRNRKQNMQRSGHVDSSWLYKWLTKVAGKMAKKYWMDLKVRAEKSCVDACFLNFVKCWQPSYLQKLCKGTSKFQSL